MLLLYRNSIDSYILILYLIILLNSCISSNNFLVESLELSFYSNTSSASSDILLLPFKFGWLYFSYLIALARTSSTMLNTSGKSGYLSLVLDLRENAFSFSTLSMMLAVVLSLTAFYYVELCSLYLTLFIYLFIYFN